MNMKGLTCDTNFDKFMLQNVEKQLKMGMLIFFYMIYLDPEHA